MTSKIHAMLAAVAAAFVALPIAAQSRADNTPSSAAQPAGLQALWTDANRSMLKEVLAHRDRHGLDHVSFLPTDAGEGPDPSVASAYTKAALDYARAVTQGLIDPSSLHDIYTITRPTADPESALAAALHNGTLKQWLDGLAPDDAEYRQLSDAYLAASRNSATQASTIAMTRNMHVGDADPRVAEIANQLVDDGYLPSRPDGAKIGKYIHDMAVAVRALQRDYGLREDGIIGPDTLGVLNLRSGDRARTLAVGLERRRWLTRTPPATRIDVNTAAAELRYFRDGKLVDRRRVIVGEPERFTPALSSPIYRLVANPTWTVPKSISVSASTVRAKHMHRVNGYWVQPSGPTNALGLVKFDMKNSQAIYLHDTSAPKLFNRSQRHLSHGCVRVADALGFAQMLADEEGVGDAWAKAHDSGTYQIVDLPHEIPVRLLYHNALVADDGQVAIRTDPYGWNDAVATKLGFSDARTRKSKAEAIDIGP